ncbi:MAG: type II toxin-antitoxin system prevent-host-death family antitoxin [Candidatus Magasanikbacteria bacterium]|nr:type II toxin-antitoxin system prevent-host-death family antitoxin [Candidatus Magasanikbacteria bacterium]
MQKTKIIGVKELRENLEIYINKINKGESFTVVKRSKPVFNIVPIESSENWEEVVDFTKIKKGGVKIEDVLSRL